MSETPDILNHNIETVPRLFPSIRPQGKYDRSIQLLDRAKEMAEPRNPASSPIVEKQEKKFERSCVT